MSTNNLDDLPFQQSGETHNQPPGGSGGGCWGMFGICLGTTAAFIVAAMIYLTVNPPHNPPGVYDCMGPGFAALGILMAATFWGFVAGLVLACISYRT